VASSYMAVFKSGSTDVLGPARAYSDVVFHDLTGNCNDASL
jgi:hypothetical protein